MRYDHYRGSWASKGKYSTARGKTRRQKAPWKHQSTTKPKHIPRDPQSLTRHAVGVERRVRVTTVAMQKPKSRYITHSECESSLYYTAHAPYCHLWPVPPCKFYPHFLTKRHGFRAEKFTKYKTCYGFLIFFSLLYRAIEQDIEDLMCSWPCIVIQCG